MCVVVSLIKCKHKLKLREERLVCSQLSIELISYEGKISFDPVSKSSGPCGRKNSQTSQSQFTPVTRRRLLENRDPKVRSTLPIAVLELTNWYFDYFVSSAAFRRVVYSVRMRDYTDFTFDSIGLIRWL